MHSHFHIIWVSIEMPLFSFSQTLHFHIHRRVKYFLSFLPSLFCSQCVFLFPPRSEWERQKGGWLNGWWRTFTQRWIERSKKKSKRKRKGEGEGEERVLFVHQREKIKYLQKFLLVWFFTGWTVESCWRCWEKCCCALGWWWDYEKQFCGWDDK